MQLHKSTLRKDPIAEYLQQFGLWLERCKLHPPSMEEPEKGFTVSQYGNSIVPLSEMSATSISGVDMLYILVPHWKSEAPPLRSSKGVLQLLRSSRSSTLLVWCEGKLTDRFYATVSYHQPPLLFLPFGIRKRWYFLPKINLLQHFTQRAAFAASSLSLKPVGSSLVTTTYPRFTP